MTFWQLKKMALPGAGLIFATLIIPGVLATPDIIRSNTSLSEQADAVALLNIHIENLANHHGSLKIAVFNTADSWLSDSLFAASVAPGDEHCSANTCTWSVQAPYGYYGVAIYHDANSNDKLDTNFLGIPDEDYGFSNNAEGFMGPPEWHKARFRVAQVHTSHTIVLQ